MHCRSTRFNLLGRAMLVALYGLASPPSVACNDPELHPELAQYQALVDSLRDQPESAVQLRYKLDDGVSELREFRVRLRFWPSVPYDKGRFTITPSSGLKVVGKSRDLDIPHKGTVEITLTAVRSGHHHLLVETVTETGGEETRHTFALLVPVGLQELDALGEQAPRAVASLDRE